MEAQPERSRRPHLWATPVVATPEGQREANLLFSVLRAQAIGVAALALMFGLTAEHAGPAVAILLASLLWVLSAMWVAHRGRIHWASYFAIFTAAASTMTSTLLIGGLRSAVVLSLVFGPTIAAVLRGRRATLVIGALVLAFVAIDAELEGKGVAPLLAQVETSGSIRPHLANAVCCLLLFVALLEKPFTHDELVERVRSTLADPRWSVDKPLRPK